MDTPSNITDTLDQADEEILNPTVSDDALEAAAGSNQACWTWEDERNTCNSIGWPDCGS
jgi:hypothetical protein